MLDRLESWCATDWRPGTGPDSGQRVGSSFVRLLTAEMGRKLPYAHVSSDWKADINSTAANEVDQRGFVRNLILVAALIGLAGCSNASAESADSNNPAHCLAAFNYNAYWFKVGNRPEKVTEYLARGLYVMERVKSAGGSPAPVLSEAKQFTVDHVKDSKVMDALGVACGKAQAHDAQFRAEFGDLIEKARPLVPRFEAAATP